MRQLLYVSHKSVYFSSLVLDVVTYNDIMAEIETGICYCYV